MQLRKMVGKNVRAMREARQLQQEELAHRAQIHVTYLSGVENGKRNPTVDVIERIANALGVSPRELFS